MSDFPRAQKITALVLITLVVVVTLIVVAVQGGDSPSTADAGPVDAEPTVVPILARERLFWSELAPNIVVASQVYHWEVVREDIIQNVQDGKLGGENLKITLENEGLVIEYNEDFDLPGDVKDKAEETIDGTKDGSISTG